MVDLDPLCAVISQRITREIHDHFWSHTNLHFGVGRITSYRPEKSFHVSSSWRHECLRATSEVGLNGSQVCPVSKFLGHFAEEGVSEANRRADRRGTYGRQRKKHRVIHKSTQEFFPVAVGWVLVTILRRVVTRANT